jgi:hypothetical protein
MVASKQCPASGARAILSTDVVTTLSTRCELGESAGDGSRRFRLVRQLRGLLRDNEIRLVSDWGSSGRRFKSCQPDQEK